MNDLTQAWMEEEALHGDEELIIVARCELFGHSECNGALHEVRGTGITMCHRHLVLHDVWCDTPPIKDFAPWLDDLENDTARIMYEANQESINMNYWREI
jgi:hypothetical protein